ncbi:MAG: type IX secretion system protein PorQ [Bacteroidales bacterium]|nr:type IX secretion system protein PorQ [Bacteroidales bacterium]
MKKRAISIILAMTFITLTFNQVNAQIGGDNTYEFLNLGNSSRVVAMGGKFLAIDDNDITLAPNNPSLITPEMDNNLALSFVDFYQDINYGFVSYGKHFNKLGSFAATMQYVNYGSFTYADEAGERYGNFTAGEYALSIGWGRQLDSLFSIGANFKTIYSSLEANSSFGIAVDIAGSYSTPNDFTVSIVARNIGTQLTTYLDKTEPLPFELQLGLSKKLEHVPFRYSILLTHLEKPDLTYDDPTDPDDNVDPLTGEPLNDESSLEDISDKVLRHVVIGGEFTPTDNISLRIGYNYRRRQELKVDQKIGTLGFSWGVGIKISRFQFNYTRSAYHLHGSPNYLTVTTDLGAFMKKR